MSSSSVSYITTNSCSMICTFMSVDKEEFNERDRHRVKSHGNNSNQLVRSERDLLNTCLRRTMNQQIAIILPFSI